MPELDKWLRLLQSDKDVVRFRAARSLAENPATPVDVLLQILESSSDPAHIEPLVRTLGNSADPGIVHAMASRLSHPSAAVRMAACDVLARKCDRSAFDTLVLSAGDADDEVRRAAARAIHAAGNRLVLPQLPEPSTPYCPQEPIFEGSDEFRPFPEPAAVFADSIELHAKYLLPLASINLSRIDPALDGLVHFLQPIEPYDEVVGAGADAYFSRTCRCNFVGFQYEANQCRLMADFDFFELHRLEKTDGADAPSRQFLLSHYENVRRGFARARSHYEEYGALHAGGEQPTAATDRLALLDAVGGPSRGGNWVSTELPLLPGVAEDKNGELRYHIVPLTDDGRPYLFVGRLSVPNYVWADDWALSCELLLFYDPETRVSLTTFDWT